MKDNTTVYKDVCGSYADTMAFYVSDLSIPGFWYGVLAPIPYIYRGTTVKNLLVMSDRFFNILKKNH